MKDRHLEEKPACSVKAAPFPEEVTCSQCGKEIEMWSDETEVTCGRCGCLIHNNKNDI